MSHPTKVKLPFTFQFHKKERERERSVSCSSEEIHTFKNDKIAHTTHTNTHRILYTVYIRSTCFLNTPSRREKEEERWGWRGMKMISLSISSSLSLSRNSNSRSRPTSSSSFPLSLFPTKFLLFSQFEKIHYPTLLVSLSSHLLISSSNSLSLFSPYHHCTNKTRDRDQCEMERKEQLAKATGERIYILINCFLVEK